MNNDVERIEGIHYENGKAVRVEMSNGLITSIEYLNTTSEKLSTIAPGFVDLQINGYQGVDFNDVDENPAHLHGLLISLLAKGVTTFYPTIITNSIENMKRLTRNISKWRNEDKLAKEMIVGIHLEGPFISKEDGPRGAHDLRYILQPNWNLFKEINQAAGSLIKIITLSPEWRSAASFIEQAVNEKIIVAIGHTAANSEQIKQAVNAGARFSTHLGNGAHSNLPRHPNYIWDQLSEELLVISVIADGFHLPFNLLKVFQKVKQEKMIVVSDSVSLAGLPPGEYRTPIGGKVNLTAEGRLHLKEDPRLLAGSVQSILEGVNHLMSIGLSEMTDVIKKASIYPAKLLNLPQQKGLTVGAPADLILFEQRCQQIKIKQTIKSGRTLYKQGEE